ncbi:MAG: hypothetical protein ACOYOF_04970 [Verrucomicrobiaceae bacterium]
MPANDLEVLPRSIARRVRTLGHALSRVQAGLQLMPKRLERGLLDASSTAWIYQWAGSALDSPSTTSEALTATIVWQENAWLVSEVPPVLHGALLLLHLPVLRDFWRKELRAARYERLRHVLPKVWAMDPTTLPPGAVIAGLGITNWHDLSKLEAKGRHFEIKGELGLVIEQTRWKADGSLTLTWKVSDDGRIDL